jgi:hypothetical protein
MTSAAQFYHNNTPPASSHDNIWDIYLTLPSSFEGIQDNANIQTASTDEAARPAVGDDFNGSEHMDLLPLKHSLRRRHAASAGQSD